MLKRDWIQNPDEGITAAAGWNSSAPGCHGVDARNPFREKLPPMNFPLSLIFSLSLSLSFFHSFILSFFLSLITMIIVVIVVVFFPRGLFFERALFIYFHVSDFRPAPPENRNSQSVRKTARREKKNPIGIIRTERLKFAD